MKMGSDAIRREIREGPRLRRSTGLSPKWNASHEAKAVCDWAVREPPLRTKCGFATPALDLTNYCAVVAEDLDHIRVGVEDANLHGRRGEQEPEDAAPEVAWLRRLDPTNFRVLQVSIGGNEPLQDEAQRDSQGESEGDAAKDHEVEITPIEIDKTQPEGDQEEDRR